MMEDVDTVIVVDDSVVEDVVPVTVVYDSVVEVPVAVVLVSVVVVVNVAVVPVFVVEVTDEVEVVEVVGVDVDVVVSVEVTVLVTVVDGVAILQPEKLPYIWSCTHSAVNLNNATATLATGRSFQKAIESAPYVELGRLRERVLLQNRAHCWKTDFTTSQVRSCQRIPLPNLSALVACGGHRMRNRAAGKQGVELVGLELAPFAVLDRNIVSAKVVETLDPRLPRSRGNRGSDGGSGCGVCGCCCRGRASGCGCCDNAVGKAAVLLPLDRPFEHVHTAAVRGQILHQARGSAAKRGRLARAAVHPDLAPRNSRSNIGQGRRSFIACGTNFVLSR